MTILILSAPLKIGLIEFLPGLILMWGLVIMFKFGILTKYSKVDFPKDSLLINKKASILSLFIGITFIVFIPFYVFFYSGNSFEMVITSLSGPANNYNNYQRFFEENNLSGFSINKLPYILSFAVIKLFASITIIKIIAFQNNKKMTDYLSLLLIFLSFLYSTFGRGTSFELFELIMLVTFTFLFRIQLRKGNLEIPTKNIIQICLLGLIVSIYFITNIAKRYGIESIIESDFDFVNCATDEFCIDKNAILVNLSPLVGITVFQMANYFIFGVYFTSKLITGIVLTSLNGLLSIVIPIGAFMFYEKDYKSLVCNVLIDCGVNWIPEIISLLLYLGIFGTIIFIYYMSIFSVTIVKKAMEGSLFSSLLLFYMVCFMISLPSGNYVTASSSNQLCILFCILISISPIERKYFINF